MSRKSKWEYLKAIYLRYQKAARSERKQILDEFSATCGYHRKHAIRLLNGPLPEKQPRAKGRRPRVYDPGLLRILSAIWRAAGYPWSARLKALLPLWMPWARERFSLTQSQQKGLLSISPASIDRHLREQKSRLKKNLYGRTKPGTLLKHHIPIKTDRWELSAPGFTEVDLVSHSGDCADGEFIHCLNQTDIHSTWVETRAVLGKAQHGVVSAMDEMRRSLPFRLRGIDSDNGSEFINNHLLGYCQGQDIQFTRGRPYKKDDNAHIEQKNWTHVRKLLGYVRYDSEPALEAINELYRNELRLFQNLFQPSVKLLKKVRVGSRIRRVYGEPKTPFQRVCESAEADPAKIAELQKQLRSLNPFELAQSIERKLERIYQMAHHRKNSLTLLREQGVESSASAQPGGGKSKPSHRALAGAAPFGKTPERR